MAGGRLADLQNLREYSVYGYGGYFNISPDDLQREINNRVKESGWKSVNIYPRDAASQEFSIYLSNVKDTTLKDAGYEPNDYMEISVTLQVKVNTANGATDGDLELGHFTVKEDTLNPYLVDYKRTVVLKQLDIIEEANSVTWSMKDDLDELEIEVERKDGPKDPLYASRRSNEGAKYTIKTSFPNTLDWGCDKIPEANKPRFCYVLSDHKGEIVAAGKHIANMNTAQYDDHRGEDTTYVMEIKKITGNFKKILPFVQEGQKSVYAFRGSSHETVGIAYHCINEK